MQQGREACDWPSRDLLAQVGGVKAHEEQDEQRGQALEAHCLGGVSGLRVVVWLVPADGLPGGQLFQRILDRTHLQTLRASGVAGSQPLGATAESAKKTGACARDKQLRCWQCVRLASLEPTLEQKANNERPPRPSQQACPFQD